MRWEIKGRYIVDVETSEEARKIGEDMFGHMMDVISVEKENPLDVGLPLWPVNMPIVIGEEGKDLIRSVCGIEGRDMRSASCILSKLEMWDLVDGKFPKIEEARLKALQIVVNVLGRERPYE